MKLKDKVKHFMTIENEKLILDWGLSVRIAKGVSPTVNMTDNQNGYISSEYESDYSDEESESDIESDEWEYYYE